MKIQLYQERKAQLELIQNTTTLKLTHVNHEGGSVSSKVNFEGVNSLFLAKAVEYLNANPSVLIKPVIELMKAEVDQALIEANQEATAFLQVNKLAVESIESKVVELSK